MSRQFGSGLLAHRHDLVIYANILALEVVQTRKSLLVQLANLAVQH